MRWLLKRWYVWLGLVLLLGLAASMALVLASRSRVNPENLNRLSSGMSEAEVYAILGDPTEVSEDGKEALWRSGPKIISVEFRDGRVCGLGQTFIYKTTWEIVIWYAKRGAEKIGVKWD